MSVLTWPVAEDFPQDVLIDTKPTWSNNRITEQMESGPVYARLRDTVFFKVWHCKIWLDNEAQLAVLESFFNEDSKHGTVPFAWHDPITGADKTYILDSIDDIAHQGAGRYVVTFTMTEVP